MEDELSQYTDNIINSAKLLLNRNTGILATNQDDYVRDILECMEMFTILYADFIGTTPEHITSSMRHDLSNSIMPVCGYAELLARPEGGELNAEQQTLVDAINVNTESLRLAVLETVTKARNYTNNLLA